MRRFRLGINGTKTYWQ